MPAELDWEERGRRCREALGFLGFLRGRWVGQGQSQGEAVQSSFEARLRMSDTVYQCEERLVSAEGLLLHEDLAVMRYDPQAELVRVTHYAAHAWLSEQLVRPLPQGGGAFWYGGPFSPRVEFLAQGPDGLQVRVLLPEQDEPDTLLRYRRA